jgi:hypothetical protein
MNKHEEADADYWEASKMNKHNESLTWKLEREMHDFNLFAGTAERELVGKVAALIEAASSTRDILAQFSPGEVWDVQLVSLTAALAALEEG